VIASELWGGSGKFNHALNALLVYRICRERERERERIGNKFAKADSNWVYEIPSP